MVLCSSAGIRRTALRTVRGQTKPPTHRAFAAAGLRLVRYSENALKKSLKAEPAPSKRRAAQ